MTLLASTLRGPCLTCWTALTWIDRIGRPTHRCGRQLDMLISRADQTAPAIIVDLPLFSDHSLIVASIKHCFQAAHCCRINSALSMAIVRLWSVRRWPWARASMIERPIRNFEARIYGSIKRPKRRRRTIACKTKKRTKIARMTRTQFL
jgi:hypothetical protein